MILDYPDHTLLFPKKEETLTRCRFRPIPFRFPPFSFLIFSFSLITSYILLEIVFLNLSGRTVCSILLTNIVSFISNLLSTAYSLNKSSVGA